MFLVSLIALSFGVPIAVGVRGICPAGGAERGESTDCNRRTKLDQIILVAAKISDQRAGP